MINLSEYQTQIDSAIENAKLSNVPGATVYVARYILGNSVHIGWNTTPNPEIGIWQETQLGGWGYPDFDHYIYVWANSG